MQSKITQTFKNFLFPRFSELEFITLSYLVLLVVVEKRQLLLKVIAEEANRLFTIGSLDEQFKSFIALGFFAVCIFLFVASIFVNAFRNRTISFTERKTYATFFYVGLSFISILSFGEITMVSAGRWYRTIEGFILLYIFFQSLVRLTTTMFLSKQNKEELYVLQMSDKQLNRSDLLILLVVGAILYNLLRNGYGIPVTLSLAYFYTTTILYIYRALIGIKN